MRYLRHNGTHEKFDVFSSDNIANDGRPKCDEDGRKQDLKDAHVVLTIVASNINAAYIFFRNSQAWDVNWNKDTSSTK